MKILNEPDCAATFESIINCNNIRIEIGIQRAAEPRDAYFNGELRDGLARRIRHHHFTDVSCTAIFRDNNSNDGPPQTISCQKERTTLHTAVKRKDNQLRRSPPTPFATYLLYKLTQLCLVIVLMLPFLITYNTLIQQARCQDFIVPTSTLTSTTIQRSDFNLDIQIKNLRQAHTEKENNSVQLLQRELVAEQECQTKMKKLNENISNYNIKSNHGNAKRYHYNDFNQHRNTKKRGNAMYSHNYRLNGYSLIILSQSANNNNNNNLHFRMSENSSMSSNSNADTTLHDPKSILSTIANGSSTIRTKRNINIFNNSQTRENKRIHQANDQILRFAMEKKQENYVYSKIISTEKLTKLVMTGLGLKKLPDMKKANISQLEYSTKYIQYFERLSNNHRVRSSHDHIDFTGLPPTTLHIYSIETNRFTDITRKRGYLHHKRSARATENRKRKTLKSSGIGGTTDKTNILLHFPLSVNDDQFKYEKIDEANVRLMMLYNPALSAQSHRRARIDTGAAKGNRRLENNRHIASSVKNKMNCNGNTDDAIPLNNEMYGRRTKMRTHTHILNLKAYQLLPLNKRQQLDARKIEFETSKYGGTNEETRSQWLEFDVTEAVRGWLNKSHENLGIEIQCDKCRRVGARILSDVSTTSAHFLEDNGSNNDSHDRFHLTPVLNIIGHVGRTHHNLDGVHLPNMSNHQSEFSYQNFKHNNTKPIKNWPNSCYKAHQRCCRHQLDVAFKDIKGFEFIIQPKSFDAGYCRGRCPPRHNPAHHHALLQSLIWQQDHSRVPRPCCAPSKLTELEILHVDEEHSDKLKISTWSDMQVLECACS